MFDFTSSKLLILGIVALLVIGPKDLPALLRTLGKYMGIIRRHASEFRAQFDEAMRESELADLKKQVESIQQETEETIRSAEQTVQGELDAQHGPETASRVLSLGEALEMRLGEARQQRGHQQADEAGAEADGPERGRPQHAPDEHRHHHADGAAAPGAGQHEEGLPAQILRRHRDRF